MGWKKRKPCSGGNTGDMELTERKVASPKWSDAETKHGVSVPLALTEAFRKSVSKAYTGEVPVLVLAPTY